MRRRNGGLLGSLSVREVSSVSASGVNDVSVDPQLFEEFLLGGGMRSIKSFSATPEPHTMLPVDPDLERLFCGISDGGL